jgi:hypothetical protein
MNLEEQQELKRFIGKLESDNEFRAYVYKLDFDKKRVSIEFWTYGNRFEESKHSFDVENINLNNYLELWKK